MRTVTSRSKARTPNSCVCADINTQQFRHDLEVAYGVADEVIDDSRKDVTADSIMVKREVISEQ